MSWQEVLNQNGGRISAPRKRIMELLSLSQEPLNPQELFRRLQEEGERLSLASVYRNVNLLSERGLICKVYKVDGSIAYMAHEGSHHHHHIYCQQCHRAVNFSGCDSLDELISRVETESGFKIYEHILQFYGFCPECQKKS